MEPGAVLSNQAHKDTRYVVENAICELKNCFRFLTKQGKMMMNDIW